jgi:hypothetical protein
VSASQPWCRSAKPTAIATFAETADTKALVATTVLDDEDIPQCTARYASPQPPGPAHHHHHHTTDGVKPQHKGARKAGGFVIFRKGQEKRQRKKW